MPIWALDGLKLDTARVGAVTPTETDNLTVRYTIWRTIVFQTAYVSAQ